MNNEDDIIVCDRCGIDINKFCIHINDLDFCCQSKSKYDKQTKILNISKITLILFIIVIIIIYNLL